MDIKRSFDLFARFCYSYIRPKPEYFFRTKEWGLYTDGLRNPRLIVSLTSFPARIKTVSETIQSVLNQGVKADAVILWLDEEQFPEKERDLPSRLLQLKKYGLSIRWCHDIRSFKKLIPALKEFPEDVIVTIDDDVYYPPTWLGNLYQSYLRNPNMVHCNRSSRMLFDKEGYPRPYNDWGESFIYEHAVGYDILMTGVGGVLYPPHCLYKDADKEELFMSLANKADDIWFWAMAVLNGTPICVVDNPQEMFDPVFIIKNESLWSYNRLGNNDIVLENIYRQYPQLRDIFTQ